MADILEIPEFVAWPSIGRYSRNVVVTEKIDGTNAQIYIGEDGAFLTGSRSRWISPQNDNHGFSRWAHEHQDELMQLGPGHHYGEWWGSGIQRSYGVKGGVKYFSLFNAIRWCRYGEEPHNRWTATGESSVPQDVVPKCVGVVPILFFGNMDDLDVYGLLDMLRNDGSHIPQVAGFPNPEGIVVHHLAAGASFKKTLEKDDTPKSLT